MREFARLAQEFWAAVTSTARRGVRLMRVEATVHRPDHSFPIGVTTTTLDGPVGARPRVSAILDRKSTRLNSSHDQISYAVFCLNKKSLCYSLVAKGIT